MSARKTETPDTAADTKTADPRAAAARKTAGLEATADTKAAGPRATAGTKPAGPDFASASLPRHLVRGALGFGALIASFACLPAVGPVSLLLLPAGLLALRGCPMCWAIGLLQTVSRGRLQRSCKDGHCELTVRSP